MSRNMHGFNENKTCFIVCPTGKPDSDIRRRIDGIIKQGIQPCLDVFGLDGLPSYEIYSPGGLTEQIIRHLVEDPLVIGDLTMLNANVLWEMGVREAVGKPYILIAEEGTEVPSDLQDFRRIVFRNDLSSLEQFRTELQGHLGDVLEHPDSQTLTSRVLRGGGTASESGCIDRLGYIMRTVGTIADRLGREEVPVSTGPPGMPGPPVAEPGWFTYELSVSGDAAGLDRFREALRSMAERSRIYRGLEVKEGLPSRVIVALVRDADPREIDEAALGAGLELTQVTDRLGKVAL